MSFRCRVVIATLVALAVILVGGYLLLRKPAAEITAAMPPIEDVVEHVLAARTRDIVETGEVPFGEGNVINVLFLGIDSRKEGEEKHCDAIHMASVNVSDWTVHITSVPRGTYAYIPPGTYKPNEYYIANACGYAGLEYGIDQIERLIGVRADYVVTAGFSQVLGSLRALGLPTTSTLQWLRHRQSYAIGDPQRSHNQAVFLGDLMAKFATPDARVPVTMQYVLYSFVDTDMDFGTARALYEGLVASDVASRTTAVTYAMKPHYDTVDYHLDLENPDEQIAALLDRIRPYLSKDDLSDRTLEDVQAELVAYLRDAVQTADGVALVIEEETWRQVEDDTVREELQYAFVAAWVAREDADKEASVQYAADYILEKQTLGIAEWEAKGRELLSALLKE